MFPIRTMSPFIAGFRQTICDLTAKNRGDWGGVKKDMHLAPVSRQPRSERMPDSFDPTDVWTKQANSGGNFHRLVHQTRWIG